jgi:hypothetical protein
MDIGMVGYCSTPFLRTRRYEKLGFRPFVEILDLTLYTAAGVVPLSLISECRHRFLYRMWQICGDLLQSVECVFGCFAHVHTPKTINLSKPLNERKIVVPPSHDFWTDTWPIVYSLKVTSRQMFVQDRESKKGRFCRLLVQPGDWALGNCGTDLRFRWCKSLRAKVLTFAAMSAPL